MENHNGYIKSGYQTFTCKRNRHRTRNPIEHDAEYEMQALVAIEQLQGLGVKVLYTVKHHRKLAIIDGTVTWNGSLNILSQHDSCEIMWRVASKGIADQLLGFIKLTMYIGR